MKNNLIILSQTFTRRINVTREKRITYYEERLNELLLFYF